MMVRTCPAIFPSSRGEDHVRSTSNCLSFLIEKLLDAGPCSLGQAAGKSIPVVAQTVITEWKSPKIGPDVADLQPKDATFSL
jgi:hypothetical protein